MSPYVPGLLSVCFVMKGAEFLSDALSTSIEMIVWFLSFILLIWWITLTAFHILNHPCIHGINPTWSVQSFVYF